MKQALAAVGMVAVLIWGSACASPTAGETSNEQATVTTAETVPGEVSKFACYPSERKPGHVVFEFDYHPLINTEALFIGQSLMHEGREVIRGDTRHKKSLREGELPTHYLISRRTPDIEWDACSVSVSSSEDAVSQDPAPQGTARYAQRSAGPVEFDDDDCDQYEYEPGTAGALFCGDPSVNLIPERDSTEIVIE